MVIQKIKSTEQYYFGGFLIEGESIGLRITVEGQNEPIWLGAGNRKPFSYKWIKAIEKDFVHGNGQAWSELGAMTPEQHKEEIETARDWFDNYLHPELQLKYVREMCWYLENEDAPNDYEIVQIYNKYL